MKKTVFMILLLTEMMTQSYKLVDISVPKTGTFLLMRTMELLTKNHCVNDVMPLTYTPTLRVMRAKLKSTGFLCLHLVYRPEYEKFFKENNIKVNFIYRDPRDQLVSQVHFMFKLSPNKGRFDFNSLLTALIGDNEKSPHDIFYPFQDMDLDVLSSQEYISHVKRFYEGFLGWKDSSICYVTRFEDLVGPKGEGSAEKQKQEIVNIAKHIGLNLTEEKVNYVAENMFGKGVTFREGKIGSWKKYFTEEHKKQFKAVAGDLLIQLGYEKDNNW